MSIGRSCSCFNVACCLCTSFCSAIFFFVVALYIFWLIFRPHNLHFSITDASLNHFNFTFYNATLHYDLAVNITIENPNKKVAVHYDHIRAYASYGKNRFATANLTLDAFFQPSKRLNTLRAFFVGERLGPFEEEEIAQYYREKSGGIYSVDVKLDVRMRLRYGKIKTGRLKPPELECLLKIPVSSDGKALSLFEATSCGHVITSIVLAHD